MELAMNLSFGSLLSANAPITARNDGMNATEFTQMLADSILADKIIPLNQQVAALQNVDGFINGGASYATTTANTDGVDFSKVQQFLKGIPIYNEVLTFHVKDKMHIGPNQTSKRNQYNMQVSSQKLGNDLIERMSRKRSADNFGDDLSAVAMSMKIDTNAHKAHSQSDNSSTFSVECMDRMQNKPSSMRYGAGADGVPTPSTGSLDLDNAYTGVHSSGTYKPIIVPKGDDMVIPEGYIKVDAERSASRKTKVVTACEHTDKKHYAKGLCSTCYHKGGRTKLSWNCEHKDQLHYAKGCCQECYLQFHSKRGKKVNKKKTLKMKQDDELIELLQLGVNETFEEYIF